VNTPYGDIPQRLAKDMSLAEQHDWLAVRASRRSVLRGMTVLGASASPLLWERPARASASVRVLGRMLAPGADPGREMVVGVAVSDALRGGRVEATAMSGSAASGDLEVQVVRGSSVRYARVALTGLQPDTDYAYRVTLDGVAASSGTFRTAPATGAGFRFTAFGDQGLGADARSVLRRVRQLRPAVHVLAGDLCYANQNGNGEPGAFTPRAWDDWLAQNDPVASTVPFLCTMGNHEMEPGFDRHGYAGVLARVPWPGRSPLRAPASWALRYGTVGFVGLDSNDVSHELSRNRGYTGSAQRDWLDSVLAGFRAPDSGVEFVVAVMHHSPYSTNQAHGSEGGVREQWVPLFDRHAVDLVIAGHNHCYERTLPLRAGAVTGTDADRVDSTLGTTYVTAGGGGASGRNDFIPEGLTRLAVADGFDVEKVDWSLPERTSTRAVVSVDVRPGGRRGTESTLTLTTVDADGGVVDSTELRRPATVDLAVPQDGGWSVGRTLAIGAAGAGLAATAAAGRVVLHRRRFDAGVPVEDLPPPGITARPLVTRPGGEPPLDAFPADPFSGR
jgi:hypothetical protein